MDNAKIYGLCLERIRYQLSQRKASFCSGELLLEGFLTSDIEEIVDLLELYDLCDRTPEALQEKLDDLAFTVSVLLKERFLFGYDHKGHLGLYVVLPDSSQPSPSEQELEAVTA